MRTIKAALVVLDYNLYPRNNVDQHNVRAIMDALEAGEEMPPIIIDRHTKKAVDGFHRTLAKLKRDPDSEIEVIEKTYKNESEMFLDAMRYNSTHGARLDPCDRVRCTIIAEKLSIPLAAVAGALHVPAEKLGALKSDRTATTAGGLSIPLKRTIQHMAGQKLTKAQNAANDKLSGMNQVFYVNQVILLIESNLLNKEDEKLLDALRHLSELLEGLLTAT